MKSIFFIFILQFIIGTGYAQSRWVGIYHDEEDAPMKYILESYDKGYLLSGKSEANYSKYNWIIKTDINGEILWEKTIGDGIHSLVLFEMAMNESGSLYTSGESRHEDPYGDPIILKLNACGEKEWCKVLHSPDHHDFAHCICVTPDGGCVVTLVVTGTTLWEDRICLAKFSPDGELEWNQCYNSLDSLMGNELDENLIITPDYGFLISGWCYHNDPSGTLAWVYPYYIKTDSLGNFEWEKFALVETTSEGGQAWHTTIGPNNQFYYSSISHYFHENNTATPALVKMDMNGNLIDVYDLKEPNESGKLFDARFINDMLLAASTNWGIDEINSPMAVIIDTLGNIVDSAYILVDDYMSYVRPIFDNKILFYTHTHVSGEFDVYLFKFNQELDDDTLYSFPFTYDSLCPYQITSDTIGFDGCDLIVGIEEEEETWGPGDKETGGQGEEGALVIWPNPASNIVNCQLSIVNCQSNSSSSILHPSLVIYDIFGRPAPAPCLLVPRSPDPKDGGRSWQVDVSALPPGIYLMVLKDERTVLGTAKFIIAR